MPVLTQIEEKVVENSTNVTTREEFAGTGCNGLDVEDVSVSNIPVFNISKPPLKYCRKHAAWFNFLALLSIAAYGFFPNIAFVVALVLLFLAIPRIIAYLYRELPKSEELQGEELATALFDMQGTWTLYPQYEQYGKVFYAEVKSDGEAIVKNPARGKWTTHCTKAIHKIRFFRLKDRIFMKMSLLKGPWEVDLESGAENHEIRGEIVGSPKPLCYPKWSDYNQEIYAAEPKKIEYVDYAYGTLGYWERTELSYMDWVLDWQARTKERLNNNKEEGSSCDACCC